MEEAVTNNEDDVEAAAEELEETLNDIVEAVEEADLAEEVFDDDTDTEEDSLYDYQ